MTYKEWSLCILGLSGLFNNIHCWSFNNYPRNCGTQKQKENLENKSKRGQLQQKKPDDPTQACGVCEFIVYPNDQKTFELVKYHAACFRCSSCGTSLNGKQVSKLASTGKMGCSSNKEFTLLKP